MWRVAIPRGWQELASAGGSEVVMPMVQCNLRPLGGMILVQCEMDGLVRDAVGMPKRTTLLLPPTTKANMKVATVLRAGEGGTTQFGAAIPMPVKAGDRVLIMAARLLPVDEMDSTVCLAISGDVFAVIEDAPEVLQ